MSRRWTTAVVICVAVWLVNTSGQAPSPKLPYRDGELLMEFREDSTPAQRAAFMAGQQARRIRRFEALGIERVQLRGGQSVADAVAQFSTHPDVVSVQPNYERAIVGDAPPNDPYWLSDWLWGLRQIQADRAWTDYTTGADTVVIANIDTGVNYTHPDLVANMWRNTGEIAGNQKDDDGNGYVDDVYGIDTTNNDGDPMDDHGHGTHTAGTAAAAGNNGVGVVGVSWRSKILACKFLASDGRGYDSDAIECFNYVLAMRARGVNVRVTSNSWGGVRSGAVATSMKNAINAMGSAGIVSVFAAGNAGADNDTTPTDPASIPVASIISVAASDGSDARAGFSNFGVTSVDLAAPGVSIISTAGGDYSTKNGTSMAAPHVAGAAALIASAVPSISMTSLKTALLNSVDQSPAWTGQTVSGGRLNVWRAVMAAGANAAPTISITNPTDGAALIAPAATTIAANASDPDGTVASVQFFVNGAPIGTDSTAPYSVAWNGAAAGTYALRAKATDNLGATKEATVTVTVSTAPVGGSASATFVGTDTTTQGNWIGAYGTDGRVVSGDVSTLPGYANVTLGGASHIWATSTADVRALQRDGGAGRVAGTRYGSTFSVDINITDGKSHDVALYVLDWDGLGRSERIDVVDAASSAILTTRTVSSFNTGHYLVWRLSGHVRLEVRSLAGPNAVVSGVFFGSPSAGSGPPLASATFLGTDTATQGNWVGGYGGEGYGIAGDTSSLPGYATVAFGGSSHVWSSSSAEIRALQRATGAGRVAGTWYGNTLSIDLNLTDGQPHRVALYLLDWDTAGRSERIDVLDAATSAVLNSQTTSGFSGGRYLVWTLSGHVRLQVTSLAGPNAVVSAIFFGPGSGPSATPTTSATFVGTDAATQGNWAEAYGAEGYGIAGDTTSLPGYATVTVGGASYVWASVTGDVRALRRAAAAGRVAGTWYGSTFSIELNLTDGQAHQVALYLLDWDTTERLERIDVIDVASSAVLDSRTASAFNGGRYLVWTLSGHVRLQVTSLAGFNAVVSGVFFGPGNGSGIGPTASTALLTPDAATPDNGAGMQPAEPAILSRFHRSSETDRSGTRSDGLRVR